MKELKKIPPLKNEELNDNEDSDHEVLRNFEENKSDINLMKKVAIFVYIILILFGIGTGYLLSKKNQSGLSKDAKTQIIKTDKTVGSTDTQTFKDSASGTLEKGGIDGEGTHKLIRPGGDSQTVYLISSVIDMDQFVGKKVTVWGQTMAAQKAGWLMDVGKVELE